MPHSSGGGSHGGGSHHSSSHHSSGGGGSRSRTSRTAFPGARRYVIYRNNRAEYVYSDHDLTKPKSKLRYLILLFYVPFIFAIGSLFVSAIHHPTKLEIDYTPSIMIDDYADVISTEEESVLMDTMMSFYQKTGISPYVMTVHNEEWFGYYDNMEQYAFDKYVNMFPDEKHWLVIYSQPINPDENFIDWFFEGMQGNDTDDILTEKVANDFTDELERFFLDRTHYTVGQAFNLAFTNCSEVAMKTTMERGNLIMGIIMAPFIGVHMFFMVFFDPDKKYQGAVECKGEQVQEDTCDYCGGVYVVGTVTSCPHCNGVLRPHTYYADTQKYPYDGYTM